MIRLTTHLALAALLALPATSLLAQTDYHQRHAVNHRRHHQQARIDQGVRSGQITPRGEENLEARQHAIHTEERADRAADGGHLTAQDRHRIARQQNRQSARVYRDKHNAVTDPGVAPR